MTTNNSKKFFDSIKSLLMLSPISQVLKFLFKGAVILFLILNLISLLFYLFPQYLAMRLNYYLWHTNFTPYVEDKNLATLLSFLMAIVDGWILRMAFSWKEEEQKKAYTYYLIRWIAFYAFITVMDFGRPADKCVTKDLNDKWIFENCGKKKGRYGYPVIPVTPEILKEMEKQKGNIVEKDTTSKSKAERDKEAEELIKRLKEAQPR